MKCITVDRCRQDRFDCIEVDAEEPKTGTDAVSETNEANNTTVIGPIP